MSLPLQHQVIPFTYDGPVYPIAKLGTEEEITYSCGPNYSPDYPMRVRLVLGDMEYVGGGRVEPSGEIIDLIIPWGYKLSPKSILYKGNMFMLVDHVDDDGEEADHRSVGAIVRYKADHAAVIVKEERADAYSIYGSHKGY